MLAISSGIVISIILSGAWLALKGQRAPGTNAPPGVVYAADPVSLAAAERTATITTVSGFLAAKTIEEKLKFVRHPDVVGEKIRKLFQDQPRWTRNIPSRLGDNPNFRHLRFDEIEMTVLMNTGSMEEPSTVFFLSKSTEGSYLIDWDATKTQFETSLTKFRERRPTHPERFWLFITPDNYYNHGFTEEAYYCMKVTCLADPDMKMYAYIKKRGPVENSIHEIYPPIGNFFGKTAVVAELRYLPESNSSDHAEFVSLVYPNWILPDRFYSL